MERRRRGTAGSGMHWGVLGASKESVLAEGDYADVVAPPGKRATWETANLSHLLPFPPLYVSIFPLHPAIQCCTSEVLHSFRLHILIMRGMMSE